MKKIELFAGCGGLGLGLKRAGFSPFAVVEKDSWSCATLRKNKFASKSEIHNSDIKTISFEELGTEKIDLVSGGPPCQPFSIGGKHFAYNDSRDLFPDAVRIVRELLPKAFVFENVRGLARPRFSNYLQYIKLQLEYPFSKRKQGEDWQSHYNRLQLLYTNGANRDSVYKVVHQVVDAADYGVPQNRLRLFIVGFRTDLSIRWSFPAKTHSRESLVRDLFVTHRYWERHKLEPKKGILELLGAKKIVPILHDDGLLPWRTVRDTIYDLPDPRDPSARLIDGHIFQSGAKAYKGHTGSILDWPAKTLKAGDHGVPGGENMLSVDGAQRYFTVRESCRLQTFPDDYSIEGSWTESMRQIGNAVPVILAERIGKSIRMALDSPYV